MSPSPEILAQAQRLISEGAAAAALALLEPHAEEPEAAFLAARAEEALGKTAQARDRLLALRARLPRSTAPLEMQLGIVLQKLGDMAGAVACMQSAVALKPELSAAHTGWVNVKVMMLPFWSAEASPIEPRPPLVTTKTSSVGPTLLY